RPTRRRSTAGSSDEAPVDTGRDRRRSRERPTEQRRGPSREFQVLALVTSSRSEHTTSERSAKIRRGAEEKSATAGAASPHAGVRVARLDPEHVGDLGADEVVGDLVEARERRVLGEEDAAALSRRVVAIADEKATVSRARGDGVAARDRRADL